MNASIVNSSKYSSHLVMWRENIFINKSENNARKGALSYGAGNENALHKVCA